MAKISPAKIAAAAISPAEAGEDKAVDADSIADVTDIEVLKQKAEQGDAAMQFALALRYSKAEGVKYDIKEAIKWYEKAAVQGHAEAQFVLGLMNE